MASSLSRCFVLATFSWNIASRYVVFIGQPEDLRASVLPHKFLFPVGSWSLFRVMERRRQWHSGVTTIWEGNKTAAPALDDCFISVKRQAICASVSIETCRDCVYRPCGNRRALFHTTPQSFLWNLTASHYPVSFSRRHFLSETNQIILRKSC